MSNIQTGAERMPHDLSHLGFLAGQIGRLITISTTPVIAGDSFEMDAVGALRLSPLRRGRAIDSAVDIFTVFVPHRHVYGESWVMFLTDGVNANALPTVNTTGYIDHAAFLGTINPDTNKIPKHLFQGYLNIYNNYFKSAIQGSNVPNPDEAVPSFVSGAMAKAGKGLLEGTLQAGTSAVSDKLLDLVGLGGKSAADKGKDTRDYLAAAFPELNAWERA